MDLKEPNCWYYVNRSCKFPTSCKHFHPIYNINKETERPQEQKPLKHSSNLSHSSENHPRENLATSHQTPSIESKKKHPICPLNPQGLPNLGNICFAISSLHLLSRLLPSQKLQEQEIHEILKKTTNLLNGKYTGESPPQEIAKQFWTYIKKLWPEYNEKNLDGNYMHHDAAEFLMRLIHHIEDEDHEITSSLIATINCTTRCTNENCEAETTT